MNRYCLLGEDIQYSLSPLIHNYLFDKYNIKANYTLANVASVSTSKFQEFSGGNITIPYKQKAILKDVELENHFAKRDKAINTFKVVDNQITAISTDQYGIIDSIYKLGVYNIKRQTHIVFGDGATSKMLVSVLINDLKIPATNIYVISRKKIDLDSKPKIISKKMLGKYLRKKSILYNTTPLGNANNAEISPFSNRHIKQAQAVLDLGYLPHFNKLAKMCYNHGVKYQNGLNMLIVQALHSFKYWNDVDVSREYTNIKTQLLYATSSKLIVVAMPFAGKSTLQKKFKSCSIDLDIKVEKAIKIKNNDYINQYGIQKFRDAECEQLKLALADPKIKVIFLGGGTLTNPNAIDLLSDELLVYMQVRCETLINRFDKSRANIQSEEYLINLYKKRDPHYTNISQIRVSSRGIERVINEYLDYQWT